LAAAGSFADLPGRARKTPFNPISGTAASRTIPKKPAPNLIRGGYRFSGKIVRQEDVSNSTDPT
jgi:hypothetical protein